MAKNILLGKYKNYYKANMHCHSNLSDGKLTPEELKEYNHKRYEKEKEKRLNYQKEYYKKHKEEIKKKTENRYKIKCGLRIEK